MEISRKGNIVLTRIQPANIIGIELATRYTETCYWVHWNVLLGTLERATGYTETCYWVHWNVLLGTLERATGYTGTAGTYINAYTV